MPTLINSLDEWMFTTPLTSTTGTEFLNSGSSTPSEGGREGEGEAERGGEEKEKLPDSLSPPAMPFGKCYTNSDGAIMCAFLRKLPQS